jgi:hypothetical protein
MQRSAILAVLYIVALTAVIRADEPPRPPTREVRLASGRVVDYTIHFDRNSLKDSLRLTSGLIGLTSSGVLLRFELPAVRLVRERIDIEEVTCLGRGEGAAVFAGLSDGRVCQIDSATLDLTEVAKLPAAPRWIGWSNAAGNRPAGRIVVTRQNKPLDRDGMHWDVPYSAVHDLATGKTFSLEWEATTFLLNRAGRLWLGADQGEWGGKVTRVDLVKGTVTAINPPPSSEPGQQAFWEGVYGFVELLDGQIWAFGGTSHMGMSSGEITRVDVAEPRTLFAFEPRGEIGNEDDFDRPSLPITHIVEENAGLLIFSYSDVFRVDKALKSWKKVADLAIQYRWGRPDAVGSYPSVRAVHPPSHEGEPYILATVVDGYVLLEGPNANPRTLPGQFGASNAYRVMNTSNGTLFFASDDRLPPWTLSAKGWELTSLASRFEIDQGDDAAAFEKDAGTWYETCVLEGPGGAIYTVSGTGVSAGTRTTARRINGKSLTLGRETSSLDPSSSFITADGILWNAWSGELKRFAKGRWESMVPFPQVENSLRLAPFNANAPPWLLLDGYNANLWRLDYGTQGDKPRLTRVAIVDGGKTLRVDDAIPWPEGSLLLATDAGLRTYSANTRTLSRINLPEPTQRVTTLVRDGLGRLWMGGGSIRTTRSSSKGLWLSDPRDKAQEAFDRVPWIGRSEVYAIVPDPQHGDGVIVALGSRGVAFVRARQKP